MGFEDHMLSRVEMKESIRSLLGFMVLSLTYLCAHAARADSWTNTGAMNTVRYDGATANLLTNGLVIVAGGNNGLGPCANTEIYDPQTGLWTNTGDMASPRFYQTSTLLPNGTVLVAGGYNTRGFAAINATEIFVPNGSNWTTNSPMLTARAEHTATLLRNGKVLTVGGKNSNGALSSAEIYDPATGKWTPTGGLNTARYAHTAILLPDGKVLVAGGYNNGIGILWTSELYDVATGTWSDAGGMAFPRMGHTMTLRADGGVLVAGGFNFNNSAYPVQTESFDSTYTWMWWGSGSLNTPRRYHSANLLLDGRVLLAGGDAGNSPVSEELFDPATSTWSVTASLTYGRDSHVATLLPNGKVLVAGGGAAVAELFDPGTNDTSILPPQIFHVTSPLNLGGSLVITGAQFGSTSGSPLVQLRSLESGQTLFLTSTNWGTNFIVSQPVWNFPPGVTLATVFANGVHGAGSIFNISVPTPSAPMATGATSNNAFQISFTNSVGSVFGVLSTTNLSLPLTNWTANAVTEIAPGRFQFVDTLETNCVGRFYRTVAP